MIIFKETKRINSNITSLIFTNENGKEVSIPVDVTTAKHIETHLSLLEKTVSTDVEFGNLDDS